MVIVPTPSVNEVRTSFFRVLSMPEYEKSNRLYNTNVSTQGTECTYTYNKPGLIGTKEETVSILILNPDIFRLKYK